MDLFIRVNFIPINISLFIYHYFQELSIFEENKFIMILKNMVFGLIMLFLKVWVTVTSCRCKLRVTV